MQGGCFSISSLGGIGGTVVHADRQRAGSGDPRRVEVGDETGVGRQRSSQPRLILPLSLSYDHRVIDGAAAARFTAYLAQLLGDMRRVLL